MNEFNHSAFLRADETRRQITLDASYRLAGSGLMLILCVLQLVNLVQSLVGGYLASHVALSYLEEDTHSVAFALSTFLLLLIAVIYGLYTYAFWRCHRGGKQRNWQMMFGGLKMLRVFLTISLVSSALSILSSLSEINSNPVEFIEAVFMLVYYILLRKTVCAMIENAEADSFHRQIPSGIPILLFIKVGFSVLTFVLENRTLQNAALTAVSILSLLVSLLIAICLTLLLNRYRELQNRSNDS